MISIGVERYLEEVASLAQFDVFLLSSVSKYFCNYPIGFDLRGCFF